LILAQRTIVEDIVPDKHLSGKAGFFKRSDCTVAAGDMENSFHTVLALPVL
jgi:hypothetical protein